MTKRRLVVLGSSLVLVTVFVVTNFLLTTTPAPLVVVKDFWAAMEPHPADGSQQSDYARAYAHFSADLRREQSLSEFQQLALQHSAFFQPTNRRWVTSDENGFAMIDGRFTTQDDVLISSARFQLVKHQDTWEIAAFRIEGDVDGFEGGTLP